MQNLHLLRRYIREAIDLGNIQFSPDRRDGASTNEPNTPEEQKLYSYLMGRLSGFSHLSTKTANTLIDLINSDKYGERGSGFFAGPANKQEALYRGQNFDEAWFNEYIDGDISKVKAIQGTLSSEGTSNAHKQLDAEDSSINYNFKKSFFFGPGKNEGFRGWTPERGVATSFAIKYTLENDYNGLAVLLSMYPEDNEFDALLDFRRGIYSTKGAQSWEYEREVMNLRPVLCRTARIVKIKPSGSHRQGRGYEEWSW